MSDARTSWGSSEASPQTAESRHRRNWRIFLLVPK
jgi:hypothetical protein